MLYKILNTTTIIQNIVQLIKLKSGTFVLKKFFIVCTCIYLRKSKVGYKITLAPTDSPLNEPQNNKRSILELLFFI